MSRPPHRPRDWPAKAVRMGELLLRERLHPAVLAWTARRPKSEPWCVAFSGGADSLALLFLLWGHWPERRRRLVALHFNHRLRGRASTADAAFCRNVCRALGVKLRVGEWLGAHPGASEAETRAARHVFFAREMMRAGARTLWLAHQQDDIAESLLMRLSRGSGTGGLAAPRPVQLQTDGRVHLRPLLTLKKAELVAALRAASAVWREDASNAGENYFRNRVRRTVLPALAKAAGRDALAGMALSRERLEEDDAALEAWLAELKPCVRGRLELRRLQGKPRALWRRALHRWLLMQPLQSDLSRQGFAVLLAAVECGRPTRFSLGVNGFAVIRDHQLRLEMRRRRRS